MKDLLDELLGTIEDMGAKPIDLPPPINPAAAYATSDDYAADRHEGLVELEVFPCNPDALALNLSDAFYEHAAVAEADFPEVGCGGAATIRPHLCGSTNTLPVISIEQWRRERDEREAKAAMGSECRYLNTGASSPHVGLRRRLQRRNARLQGLPPGGPGVA